MLIARIDMHSIILCTIKLEGIPEIHGMPTPAMIRSVGIGKTCWTLGYVYKDRICLNKNKLDYEKDVKPGLRMGLRRN